MHPKTKLILIALCIFLFSISLRLWNLNAMGRVWDENSLLEKGYYLAELIRKGDFTNSFWYKDAADHPPFGFYIFGPASYGDFIRFDKHAPSVFSPGLIGAPIFHYDLTYGRMVSVVISSLAVLLVFLMGVRYFSLFVGIVSSMILAMMPHFLAYSQLVELEAFIVLFFTACAFSYFLYLETQNRWFLVLTGILTGINLEIKQSNLIIGALYLATFFTYTYLVKKSKNSVYHFIPLGVITFITFFVLYPMPWFHLQEYLSITHETWLKGGKIPELLFGIHMGAPFFYYLIAVAVTTPAIILFLTALGIKIAFDNRKKWIYVALVIWFCVPFLMSFFHIRQHMIRYIVEFYAPLALLSAIAFEYILKRLTKKPFLHYMWILPLFLYLFITLIRITPYYLDYFNELVGGTKTVYEKKLFFIGWWGQGLKDGGMYVSKHAKRHARVGLAINPNNNVLYKRADIMYEPFHTDKDYDYVIVNAFTVTRLGFDEKQLAKNYVLVHTVFADGGELVHVYKHK